MELAKNRKLWRDLVVAIEPEDTLELQRRKKSRRTRSSGGSHRSHRCNDRRKNNCDI